MGPPGTKVFIGNLPDEVDQDRLRSIFESVGPLAEFDIIKNYGFVHFETEADANRAVQELNETKFDGNVMKVEASRSTVRHKPGMGNMTECYRCGKSGHWSKDCPTMGGRGGGGYRGRGRGRGRGGDRPPPYGRDDYRDRDPYADHPYYRRRYLPPPPAYDRYAPYDPYERRRMSLARDPYYMERERDYYDRLAARDAAYYEYYARRRAGAYADEGPGPREGVREHDRYAPPPRPDPSRSRVPGPY